jgi:hypothetical protein
MPNDRWWSEDEDDELRDDEFSDEDTFDDDSTATIPCPACGAEVYEDAPQCPQCGSYITHDSHALSGRPLWWIILGALGVLATVVALVLFASL